MPRWAKVVVALVSLGLLALVMYPVFAQARSGNGRSECRDSVHELSSAIFMYAVDNDCRLPVEGWLPAVTPPNRRGEYACDVIRKQGKHFGYALHSEVAGKETATFKDPELEVLLFETDALGPSVIANLAARNLDRHKRGSFVVRLSGGVEFVRKPVAKAAAP